jgi:branched-chain amino acid transport system ATP-binding protein
VVVLERQEITKRFGGLLALAQVDFQIQADEVVGLIAPNGSGKSTLFNVALSTFIKAEYAWIIYGLLFVGVILYLPNGLTAWWQERQSGRGII